MRCLDLVPDTSYFFEIISITGFGNELSAFFIVDLKFLIPSSQCAVWTFLRDGAVALLEEGLSRLPLVCLFSVCSGGYREPFLLI